MHTILFHDTSVESIGRGLALVPMRMNTEWLTKRGAVILLKVLPLGAKLPKGGTRDEGVEARAERGPSRA